MRLRKRFRKAEIVVGFLLVSLNVAAEPGMSSEDLLWLDRAGLRLVRSAIVYKPLQPLLNQIAGDLLTLELQLGGRLSPAEKQHCPERFECFTETVIIPEIFSSADGRSSQFGEDEVFMPDKALDPLYGFQAAIRQELRNWDADPLEVRRARFLTNANDLWDYYNYVSSVLTPSPDLPQNYVPVEEGLRDHLLRSIQMAGNRFRFAKKFLQESGDPDEVSRLRSRPSGLRVQDIVRRLRASMEEPLPSIRLYEMNAVMDDVIIETTPPNLECWEREVRDSREGRSFVLRAEVETDIQDPRLVASLLRRIERRWSGPTSFPEGTLSVELRATRRNDSPDGKETIGLTIDTVWPNMSREPQQCGVIHLSKLITDETAAHEFGHILGFDHMRLDYVSLDPPWKIHSIRLTDTGNVMTDVLPYVSTEMRDMVLYRFGLDEVRNKSGAVPMGRWDGGGARK